MMSFCQQERKLKVKCYVIFEEGDVKFYGKVNDESGCFAVLCRLVGCKAEIRDMDQTWI